MDAWALSACYPQSNFYPLSFRHPILNGRITNFYFRNCSGGNPCSKAGLCVCTSSPISIRTKPTFVNASVIVWEATAPVKLPTRHCFSTFLPSGLEHNFKKTGVSLATPSRPKAKFQSLPATLRRLKLNSIPSCSKASRVFRLAAGTQRLRWTRIFTELLVETVPQSLYLSCTSEITRQGITLNFVTNL